MKPFNLKEYIENPSRKIVTRDGRNVRIICTDRENTYYPSIELVKMKCEEEIAADTKDGEYDFNNTNAYELFFVLEKHEKWTNLYHYTIDKESVFIGNLFNSKDKAEQSVD